MTAKEARAWNAMVMDRDQARADAKDWIAVAKDQEIVIDDLQNRVDYLEGFKAGQADVIKRQEAEIVDLEKERVKYRRAMVQVEEALKNGQYISARLVLADALKLS